MSRIAAGTALVVLAAAVFAHAAPKAPAKVGPPLTAAQRDVAKKYAAAMKRGRVATDKHDYAAAVRAFDEAVALRKADAQATAERGYAHLLAGDLDAASRDLQAAQPHAATATLAGMIWFNLGLIAEKHKDADAAKHAFTESNRLHPTKAAAGKLAGAVCMATVDAAPVPGTRYASWRDLDVGLETALIGSDAPHPLVKPATDAAAKQRLCGDGCPGRGPWIVAAKDDAEDPTITDYAIVLAVGDHLIAHRELGQMTAGRCTTTDQVELAKDPSVIHVAIERQPNDTVDVDTSGNDVKPCGEHADNCHEACFYDDMTNVDDFFDAATGARLAEVTRPQTPRAGVELKLEDDFTQTVQLARTADGVALSGNGCDLRVPLPTK